MFIILFFPRLVDLGRRLDKADRAALLAIAESLKQLKESSSAAEIYRRLGDSAAVLTLHVEAKEWVQAFNLVQSQPQYKELVYLPYAHWLAENDQFVQAQKGNNLSYNIISFSPIDPITNVLLFQHFTKQVIRNEPSKFCSSSRRMQFLNAVIKMRATIIGYFHGNVWIFLMGSE